MRGTLRNKRKDSPAAPHGGDIIGIGIRTTPEGGGAGDQNIGACRNGTGRGFAVYPAIDLKVDRLSASAHMGVDACAQRSMQENTFS